MSDNQLKSVSYAEFLCGMDKHAGGGTVALNAQAAISMVRTGIAKPFPGMYFVAGAAGFLAAAFILPFIFSWLAIPVCFAASVASYWIARMLFMKSSWNELLGKGQQSEDTMEAVYDRLIEHDLLKATRWDQP
jgi:hypothetical protein